ncbi:MAG: SDR family NAD(P)-dependent oxidoreductase [Acidimicrobiia bacterium]
MTVGYAVYPSLERRGVLVTGGASGIGAEIVRQFAAQGAKVAVLDILESADLPDGVWFQPCDVRDTAALQDAIGGAVEEIGPIRVLVNSAARDDRFDNTVMNEAEWDEMQAVNLRHVYFAAQAVRPSMVAAGGGSIVNFTSPSVDRKEPNLTSYATAKAGLYGLTRSLAGELGPHGIRVNAVQPGWVFTERQRRMWWTPEAEAGVRSAQALPGLTTEADVARLVLFLAAEDSAMLTAHVYHADGGWT